jgi:hypothetical protein
MSSEHPAAAIESRYRSVTRSRSISKRRKKSRAPTGKTTLYKPHHTSIPPHSSALNNLLSAARTASTLTTSAQNAPSAAAARVLAASHSPRSPTATPRKSINTGATTSGLRCGRDAQRRSLLVRVLRYETQRNVLVLQHIWEKKSVQKISISLSSTKTKMGR